MAKRKRRPAAPAVDNDARTDSDERIDDVPVDDETVDDTTDDELGAVVESGDVTDDSDTADDSDTDKAATRRSANARRSSSRRTPSKGTASKATGSKAGSKAASKGAVVASGAKGSKRTRDAKPEPEPEPVGRTRAQQRRIEAKRNSKGPSTSLWYILGGIALAVAVVAAIVGIVLAEGKQANVQQNQPIEASGTALVQMPKGGSDPAVGATAPKLKGRTFSGEEVDISYPSVVMIVAHWCPHCQKEVPLFSPIVRDLKGPVKVHLISSGVQPGQVNYPPSKWLEEAKWPKPVADDVAQTSNKAFGIDGYPTFVAVGADGKVRARAAGEIGIERFKQMIELAGMTPEQAKEAEAKRPQVTAPASPAGVPGVPGVPGAPGVTGQPVPVPGQPAPAPGQPAPAPAGQPAPATTAKQ